MVDRSERIRLIAELRDELGELSYDDAELVMEEFGLGFMTTNDWEFERSRELGRLLRAATDDDLVSLGSHLSSETVKDAAHVRAEGREHELDVSPGLVENLRRQADDWVEPERGRRLDDEHYRAVAVVYGSALAAGRNPLRALIEEAPWSPTTKPTASRWVARARELGYLPPTDRGRARGNAELIPSAEAVR